MTSSPPPTTDKPYSKPLPLWIAWGICLLAALLLTFILWYAGHFGRVQSYDPLIYARALWGWGQGDPYNPLLERPSLAIHNNLILLLLAPLSWLVPAQHVLIGAQALSLAACLAIFTQHLHQIALQRGLNAWIFTLSPALALLGSPLLINPFFFDARPDLIGLPFITAGMLRAVRQDGYDRRALLLMLPALLVREEFALVFAAALVLAPGHQPLSRTTRWAWAIGAGLTFVAYKAWITFNFGESQGGALSSLLQETSQDDWLQLLSVKAQYLLLFATAIGALFWRGWRWLGAAIPGALGVLLNRHLPELQISTHYSLFLLPPLLAATLAALQKLEKKTESNTTNHLIQIGLLPLLIALGTSWFWSAAPGGARFRLDSSGFQSITDTSNIESQRASDDFHSLLKLHLTPDAGAALPWPYLLPYVNRPMIWTDIHIIRGLAQHQPPPEDVRFIALHHRDWPTAAADLVHNHGFNVLGATPRYALLTLDQPTPPDLITQVTLPADASPLRASWAGQRLHLLRAARLPDGRLAVTLRVAQPLNAPPAIHQRLQLFLQANPDAPLTPLHAAGGLVRIADVPPGRAVTLLSDAPLPTHAAPSLLLSAGPEAAFAPDGAQTPLLPLILDAP